MKHPQPTPSHQISLLAERDFDLRKLRSFVAVADEANFGRAAARLYITQPALSRQIQSLEAEIGVRLFDRDWNGARLTPAGEQFRGDAQRLLELSEAAACRARQVAQSAIHLNVGFMSGVAATSVIREFAQSRLEVDICVVYTWPSNQASYLLGGRVDVCSVQMPIPLGTGYRDRRGSLQRPVRSWPRPGTEQGHAVACHRAGAGVTDRLAARRFAAIGNQRYEGGVALLRRATMALRGRKPLPDDLL